MQSSRVHVLSLLLALALGSVLGDQRTCWFAGPRVDCGFLGVTAEACKEKGCCWHPAEFEGAPHIDLPWCFYSNDEPSNYAISSSTIQRGEETSSLKNRDGGNGDLDEAIFELRQSTLQQQLGADLYLIKASVREIAPGIVRFRLTDAETQRWEVPSKLFPPESFAGGSPTSSTSGSGRKNNNHNNTVDIEWDLDPFALRISAYAQSIFDSTGLRLVYKDQYIEVSTHVSSDATLYGAGERASDTLHLLRNGMPRVLWNQDKGPTFLEQNSYGSYPFVMALNKSTGASWGYFMLSSNGMEIIPTENRLSWRIIGGMIDFFALAGPTPAAVLDQLTQIVGRPTLMPYWSLGWQQSKYGYKSIWEIEQVVAKYAEVGLPLETIVTDIDHMDRWKDFTFDPINYPMEEMQKFVTSLKLKGQSFVPIIDPGIAVLPGYEPYDAGITDNVFLKEHDGKTNYLGWVWPGPTHFPDFIAETGQRFLKLFLRKWYTQVPFSGVWIDMGEPSNFCTGDMCAISTTASTSDDPPPWVCQLDCTKDIRPQLNATMRSFFDPPYQLSSSLNRQNLGTKGVSVLATHLDGSLHYNTHNVYGFSGCRATSQAVREITGKRPFVLSRSSFTGVGAYAAHWAGDNAATWDDLRRSLPAILSYGLQGIPMGGADTGFSNDISEELCARWVSLSAIAYPFARSHSDLHSIHQEPYLWPVVLQAAKKSLDMRYKLLSYLYSLHRIASENGLPVMRPLWLNYPQDGETHEIDRQVMLGEAFLVTPVLEQGAEKVTGYFPAGTLWYDMFEESTSIDTRSGAKKVEVPASISSIPVPLHMAGGHIVAMHSAEQRAGVSLVTAEVRRSPLTVVVALKHPVTYGNTNTTREDQTALGFMYLDDGESINAIDAAESCNFLEFSALVVQEKSTLKSIGELNVSFGVPNGFGVGKSVTNTGFPASCQGFEWPELQKVKILGWEKQVESAQLLTLSAALVKTSTDVKWNYSNHLEFTIPEGSRTLKHPLQLTLTWRSVDDEAEASLVRGKLQEEQASQLAAEY